MYKFDFKRFLYDKRITLSEFATKIDTSRQWLSYNKLQGGFNLLTYRKVLKAFPDADKYLIEGE